MFQPVKVSLNGCPLGAFTTALFEARRCQEADRGDMFTAVLDKPFSEPYFIAKSTLPQDRYGWVKKEESRLKSEFEAVLVLPRVRRYFIKLNV